MMIMPGHSESSLGRSAFAIQPLQEQQLFPLAQFLKSTFGSGMLPELVDPAFQHWKFFEPLSGWEDARSFVVQQAEEIVAHAALWPTFFECSRGGVGCGHILDWAARPSTPGVGISIYQYLLRLTGSAFVVGGSVPLSPCHFLAARSGPSRKEYDLEFWNPSRPGGMDGSVGECAAPGTRKSDGFLEAALILFGKALRRVVRVHIAMPDRKYPALHSPAAWRNRGLFPLERRGRPMPDH
jgi:hypothetical protein